MLSGGALPQDIQVVQIVVEGIFSRMSQLLHGQLHLHPDVRMPSEEAHRLFQMLQLLAALFQGAQCIVQILLPRCGEGIVHPLE